MTSTFARVGYHVQLTGLAMAAAALVLALLAGSGASLILGFPAGVALLLDLAAFSMSPRLRAVLAAGLGAMVAVLVPMLVFYIGGPTRVAPLVDPNVAYIAVAWASLPNVVGAVLRRLR